MKEREGKRDRRRETEGEREKERERKPYLVMALRFVVRSKLQTHMLVSTSRGEIHCKLICYLPLGYGSGVVRDYTKNKQTHAHIRTHTHTQTHSYTCTHTHAHTHTFTHTLRTHIGTHTQTETTSDNRELLKCINSISNGSPCCRNSRRRLLRLFLKAKRNGTTPSGFAKQNSVTLQPVHQRQLDLAADKPLWETSLKEHNIAPIHSVWNKTLCVW